MRISAIALCAVLAAAPGAHAQNAAAPAQSQAAPAPSAPPAPTLEPKAMEILKAASAKLAGARTLGFTATSTYERAARNGQPLYYSTINEVTLERPDKLRVITPGDGTPDEFYYDGKTMMAYVPSKNVVAVADAPPNLDKVLDAAWEKAAIYFPFADVIASDPAAELAKQLKSAFYVGRSIAVGGVETYPRRFDELTAPLVGETLSEDRLRGLAEAVTRAVRPVHNTFLLPDYRRRMVGVYVRRALAEAQGATAA